MAQTCPVEFWGKSLGIQDLYRCFVFAAIFVLILDGCGEPATVEDRSTFLIQLKTLFGLQLVETDVTELFEELIKSKVWAASHRSGSGLRLTMPKTICSNKSCRIQSDRKLIRFHTQFTSSSCCLCFLSFLNFSKTSS